MGRCDSPKENIDSLLHVKQMHFPDQPIDWDYLLGSLHSLLISQSFHVFKNECDIFSCAACQCMWKLLPLNFGVTISQS